MLAMGCDDGALPVMADHGQPDRPIWLQMPLDLPYLRAKARAIAERDFRPSFRLMLAAKDAGLVTDAAWQHGLDLPLLELIARRLGQGADADGDMDISATYLTSAPEHVA
jgi:3-hydroxyisobutyrate dehydrogenase